MTDLNTLQTLFAFMGGWFIIAILIYTIGNLHEYFTTKNTGQESSFNAYLAQVKRESKG